jgi:hypothetical protein
MALLDILSTCTANKSAVWPLCRLASPKSLKGAKFDHVVVFDRYDFLVV